MIFLAEISIAVVVTVPQSLDESAAKAGRRQSLGFRVKMNAITL